MYGINVYYMSIIILYYWDWKEQLLSFLPVLLCTIAFLAAGSSFYIFIGINDSDILEDLESSVEILNVKRLKRRIYDNGGFEDSGGSGLAFWS